MIQLLLIASAILSAPRAQSSDPPAGARELLLFHPQTETAAEQQVILRVRDTLSTDGRLTIHEDSELADLAGPEAGRDRRLQAYHAMRRAGALGTWTISFLRSEGVVSLEAFDDEHGVRALLGTKIRSLAQDRLADEHLARLSETITAVQHQLVDKINLLAISRATPYGETVVWQHAEVPPHPGFRWAFEEKGPRVTLVYETASIQKAGLQVGDLIVSINGRQVLSPPHLGRTLGPLRAGHELKLAVLRNEKNIEIAGKVESSAELIPRWQAGIVGKQAPVPVASVGATPRSSSELGGRVVLVVVYQPSMPETWEGFAVVRWIRDHDPEEKLAIVGVATSTDEQTLTRFLAEVKPGWPSLPDPYGHLTDALRVHRPPAFLLVDGKGVLRFRQVDELHLRQAIDTL